MKLINLGEAVKQIKQACDGAEENQRTPFFFVVGAGISSPPVPLASELVKEFRENAGRYGAREEPQGKRSIDEYSHWFEQAYPMRIDRQKFLRKLIKAKTVSHANLRLAHLLLSRKITNLVVTTNFDDFLTRALQLFGSQQIVCDHPKTVQRIAIDEQSDIQIVHVHGTYWFYDCCNLAGEIVDRAQTDEDTYTMRFLLDQIMYLRSPIVIGYSGWEGDVFMTALERRLKQPGLPRRIYWFCYRKQEVESLPNWLTGHQDVYFVVPDQPPSIPQGEKAEAESSAQIGLAPAAGIEPKKTLETDRNEPTLPARQVFDALIEALGPPSPELTSDPLGFFSKQLTASLPTEAAAAGESDIYFISSVIERIERARKVELAVKEQADSIQGTEALLERVRDAVRRSQYREAIRQVGGIPKNELKQLEEKQLRELMEICWSAALALYDNSGEELEGYDLVVAIADALAKLEIDDAALLRRLANALVNKGLTLGTLDRSEEEIAAYDEVLRRFGEASEPALREQVAKALVNKGFRLGSLNRSEEEIAVYDEVARRFGEASEPALREQAAKALFNKGVTLGSLNRSEEGIAAYDEVLRRFGEASEPAVREVLSKALFNKGVRLGALNRSEEGIAVYDEVVRRFGEASEPALREQVAGALFNKGVRLGALNRSEEEIAVYDEVVRRFGEASEPALREQVGKALYNKGFTLGALNRSEEEIGVYDEVVRRFGEASEPAVREQVAKALVNKGVTLGLLNRSDEGIAIYDEVVRRFGEASELALRERVAGALVNKGVRLGALNRSEEEIAVYDEVVRRFGEASEPALREQVAKALFNKGVTLGAMNRSEEEIAVYDEVVRRFGEASEPAVRDWVAKALYNKGFTLAALGRKEDGLEVYNEVVRRFGEASEPTLLEQVAKALVSKSGTLGAMNRSEEAIAVYDEVVRRFGKASEPALLERAAKALFNKGVRLDALNRSDEAIAVYDEVVRRFGEASEPALRELVADALKGIGSLLICEAKLLWTRGEEESARHSLSAALETLNRALERTSEDPFILGNLGYIAFLSGNKDEARSLLTRAIALGGEAIRQAELEDADMHPLPQDEEFRELVRSIPQRGAAE